MHVDKITVIFLLGLIVAIILHEISHGVVANYFGDDTAKRAGRLTLNPIPHVDPFGSIILPALGALALREHLYGRLRLPFEYLGDISYATYLLHFPFQLALALIALRIGLTSAFFMQGWVMIAFYIVLVAVSAACYRFFERPMQSLLRKVSIAKFR